LATSKKVQSVREIIVPLVCYIYSNGLIKSTTELMTSILYTQTILAFL